MSQQKPMHTDEDPDEHSIQRAVSKVVNGIKKLSPRWKAVLFTAVAAFVLASLTLFLFFQAEEVWNKSPGANSRGTVFPYLASAVLFFSSCVWVVLEGRAVTRVAIGSTGRLARRGGVVTFASLLLVLSYWGMAGPAALETVSRMNCYLFQNCEAPQYLQPFNYIAAAGNAAAIAVVVYVGLKCFELSKAAEVAAEAAASDLWMPLLRNCVRAMSELLVLASTVLVTSTLALFLLFMSGAELASNPQKPLPLNKISAAVTCNGLLTTASTLQCDFISVPQPVASSDKSSKPIAHSMGFVAGLSFTGALFFLFMTAGASLDDSIQKRLEKARKNSTKPEDFNAKTWLEQEGLQEGSKDLVLRGIAVLAPAATGAITLISGQ